MSVSPGIPTDDKDWTWVLDRRCAQCGVEAAAFTREQLLAGLRQSVVRWGRVLARPGCGERPDPLTWSPLEYACHVRDVYALYDRRLALMLAEDDPLYENWDQDATAVEQDYPSQDQDRVAQELDRAGTALADRFAGLGEQQWRRPGRRSDGAHFTVDSFCRYLLHDVLHHLHDVGEPDA